MKHYLNDDGSVWAFESDGSQDALIQPTMRQLSDAELGVIRSKVTVPSIVSMRQARLALLAAGKLAGVATVIESMPSPLKEAARIEWEYAATVDRNSMLMAHLALAMGLDTASLDALFMGASTL